MLHAITNAAVDAIFVKDAKRRYTFVNPAAARLMGRARKDLIGKTPEEVFDAENARIVRQTDDATFSGKVYDAEQTLDLAGRLHVLHTIQSPIRAPDGHIVAICGIVRDVTRRAEAERELHASEERYRLVVEAIPMMAWHCGADGNVLTANSRWHIYTGQTPDEARGSGWKQAIHPDDMDRISQEVVDLITGGVVRQAEYRLRRAADGQYRWHQACVVPVYDSAGHIQSWVGVAADIHEQKCAEERLERRVNERTAALQESEVRLKDRNRQLAKLASELTVTEHRERRRLAELLHGHLQQVLVAARMQIHSLAHEVTGHKKEQVDALNDILNEAMDSARAITKDLAPPLPLERDLATSFEWLAHDMGKRHRLIVAVRVGEIPEPLPYGTAVLLYTSARELLLNVAKHAGTRKAECSLRAADAHIELEVGDSGKGIDPRALQERVERQGFGLFSIRERAELLGGSLTTESIPGGGTRVQLSLPLTRPGPGRGGRRRRPSPPPRRGAR